MYTIHFHNFDRIQTVIVNFQSFLCTLADFLKYRYFRGRVVSYWISPLWGPAGGQDGSTDRRDPPRGWFLAAAGSRAAWPGAILLTKKGRRGVSWLISILLDNINTR